MTFTTTAQTANGHYPQMPQTSSPSLERDPFDDPQYEEGRESLPYLQMLNHSDPNQAGFFITSENMEAAGFVPNEEWTPHSTTFQSGAIAQGYRSLTARLLILHKSKLLMFERESGEFAGAYQKSAYDRTIHVLKTRYLVYLISKDKQLLHQSPLMLTTKGSFCGSFGETVSQFSSDMSKAYGAATGAKRPRGERFMALSVLAVKVEPQLKGKERKSWACSVATYGQPTAENWKFYFVGYNEPLKEKLLAEFDHWQGFASLEQEAKPQQRHSQDTNQLQQGHDSEPNYDYDEDF